MGDEGVEGVGEEPFDGLGVERSGELALETFCGLAYLELFGGGQRHRCHVLVAFTIIEVMPSAT